MKKSSILTIILQEGKNTFFYAFKILKILPKIIYLSKVKIKRFPLDFQAVRSNQLSWLKLQLGGNEKIKTIIIEYFYLDVAPDFHVLL